MRFDLCDSDPASECSGSWRGRGECAQVPFTQMGKGTSSGARKRTRNYRHNPVRFPLRAASKLFTAPLFKPTPRNAPRSLLTSEEETEVRERANGGLSGLVVLAVSCCANLSLPGASPKFLH